MYVTVMVFGAGVLHHAPSHCHIHVVQHFISNTIFTPSLNVTFDECVYNRLVCALASLTASIDSTGQAC
jgi:hypothetical protein